jgi:hypothetical protein
MENVYSYNAHAHWTMHKVGSWKPRKSHARSILPRHPSSAAILAYGRRFGSHRITLRPTMAILREEDRSRVQRVLEKAEHACPVSRSLACTVELQPKIELEEPVAGK